MKKSVLVLIIIILFMCLNPMMVLGHNGRLDKLEGHNDNQNVSGLGYYHFHCNNSDAHLHENGKCPIYDEIKVTIDGINIVFDVKPIIINGRTMVPIRKVSEAMGANVGWDSVLRKVTISKDANKYEMTIDSINTYFNGILNQIDVAPQIIENRTLLPIRFVVEKFGKKVDWNVTTKTVIITSQ